MGREAKAPLCGASPPWQPSGSCVSPVPEAQVLQERLPLSGLCRARTRSLASSLGASRPDCLHGLFSGTAEVDVTRVLDQGTPLRSPPVPVPLMGRSDPSTCWASLGGVGVGLWCGGDGGTCLPTSHMVSPSEPVQWPL